MFKQVLVIVYIFLVETFIMYDIIQKNNLFKEYAWRGLIHDSTEGVEEWLGSEKATAYIGFDPTAASLHVGSLLPIMGLARLQRFGHHPIAIAGGGTGLIGDPSGKTVERQLLTKEKIEENLDGIKKQLAHFLDFSDKISNPARIVNNADWLTKISFTDFLRDVGKYFTVNYMMAKESVKRRLESEEGISFTEFSYLLLQSYDYLVLFDKYGCKLQMGASDQWGNIVSGVDLIRRLRSERAYGIVYPLVTNSSGVKFGKTESGAVWLDKDMTSPYRFYQFWLNADDKDVIKYLKFFTWLNQEEIAEFEHSLKDKPEERTAQKKLAEEVTRAMHGETELGKALKASKVLFGGEIEGIPAADLLDIFADVPSVEMIKDKVSGEGTPIAEVMVLCGAASSKGEARRLVSGGGVYLNNNRIDDGEMKIDSGKCIEGKLLVLRKGRKNYYLIKVI